LISSVSFFVTFVASLCCFVPLLAMAGNSCELRS